MKNSYRDLFKVNIGIEIHTELLTKTKMFSSTPNLYGAKPNTLINEIDLGYPGSMPTVNKKAVEYGIILGTILKMELNTTNIRFDRKHYFYYDLPKGYQITQQYFPIGKNGFIEIDLADGTTKKVKINRIHLEEDSAKTIIDEANNQLLIDYNRAGVPLIEIVSDCCDLSSAKEAMAYVSAIKQILQFSEISNARMEEGSMRCDVNISVHPITSNELGTKVEIKNINSILNVGKAIDFEIDRQIEAHLINERLYQETRRFDDQKQVTVFMRYKFDSVDYHYIAEPNITPVCLPDSYVKNVINNIKAVPAQIKADLLNHGLGIKEINVLLNDLDLYKAFIKVANDTGNYSDAYSWIVIELIGIISKNKISIKNISTEIFTQIIAMIKAILQNQINKKQGKEIILKIVNDNQLFADIIKDPKYQQILDSQILTDLINKIIAANETIVSSYKERPERVEKFIIGLVMKETHGQANPIITAKIVKEILKKI